VPYARLLYHVVWATKHRTPTIHESMEDVIREAISETSRGLDVAIFAVGVMPDHVHVFAQIPPTVEVARVIGRWKGASSHAVNATRPDALDVLAWQSGYGVLSVSQSGFDRVLEYVQKQRERHTARQLYGVMERDDSGDS
jgi:putative transposase